MPIINTQRKKQRNLIIVMGGVLLVTVVVLYWGVFRGEGQQGDGGVVVGGDVSGSLTVPRGFVLDTSILMEERFRELIPYTKIQGEIKTGRSNPFVPYDPTSLVQSASSSTQGVATTTTTTTTTNATSTEE